MKKLNSYIIEKLKLNGNISDRNINHFNSYVEKILKTSGLESILKKKSDLKKVKTVCESWVINAQIPDNFDLNIYVESLENDILNPTIRDEYKEEYIEDKDKVAKLRRLIEKYGDAWFEQFENYAWYVYVNTTKNIFKLTIEDNRNYKKIEHIIYYIPVIKQKNINEKLSLNKDLIGGKRYKFRFPESKIYILSGITDLTDSMFQDKISSGIESWVRGTDKDDIKCIIKSEDSLPIESLYLKYEDEYIVDENKWNKLNKQFKEDSLNIYGGWYKHIEFRIRTDEDKKILLVSVRVNDHKTDYYTSNTYEIYFLKSDSKILNEKLHMINDY